MKLKIFLILFLLVLLFSFSAQASTRTFMSYGRTYKLFIPENITHKRPLLVLLHGCHQSASIILEKSGLLEEALSKKFFILAPEQSQNMNASKCWNWFYSEQQLRSPATEMGGIIATLERLFNLEAIDSSRVYVAGMSAGGALTHALMVCYPDYFKGAAIHSGLGFKEAENLAEGQQILRRLKLKSPEYLGPKALACAEGVKSRLEKVLILHGQDDKSVIPAHAKLISATNWVMKDLQDDGRRNNSVKITETLSSENFPHGYSLRGILKTSGPFKEKTVYVNGLKHAWGGGEIFDYFDPAAPSSNKIILDFFEL